MRLLDLLSRYRRGSRSRGAAVVEFAVICPLLMTLIFGMIEYSYMFLMRQTLGNAAREGCRIAVLQSSTGDYAEAGARIAEIMNAAGIQEGEYSVAMTHADATATPPITTETVEITLPGDKVSLTGYFGAQSDLKGWCSMRKEGV